MPFLQVVHMTGDVDRHELTKQASLSLGSHRSNDIQIDEAGVDIMHCRISWSKEGYEAVAAGTMPFEVNGTTVMRALLKAGDVLRFGTVDVRFREGEGDGTEPRASGNTKQSAAQPAANPKAKAKPDMEFLDDDEFEEVDEIEQLGGFASGLDALAAAEKKGGNAPRKSPPPAKQKPTEAKPTEATKATASKGATSAKPVTPEKKKEASSAKPAVTARPTNRHAQARPGEEDLIRSPLVLTLLGLAVALVLTGAIFWFLAGRYTTEATFNQAKTQYDESNFRGAATELDNFAIAYPKDPLALEARRLAGLARIRQHSENAAPNYEEAMKYLRQFVSEQRDREDFDVVHPDIFDHAKVVAIGSAKLAGGNPPKPDLLKISSEAKTMLKTYAPKDVPPTEVLQQVEAEVRKSEAAILKHSVYNEHLALMQAALGKGSSTATDVTAAVEKVSPILAMQVRQDLILRYPDFGKDKKVTDLMTAAIDAEKAIIKSEETGVDGLTEDHPTAEKSLTLLFQGRTRADEVSVGQSVIALAADCCYGMDLVTGAPVWRREIGLDTPFFPVIDAATSYVVMFDARHNELVCVQQHTGKFLWRQPLGSRVRGNPYIVDGTVFTATEQAELLAIDLESGRIRTRLTFSQAIGGPLEVKSGHLVVAGHEDVVYELTKRPLACVNVHYFGQPAGSVQAPLSAMGSYVLMIQNLGENSTLRLLETNTADKPFLEVATGNVGGRVFDEPVIRGRDLFIPSTGERISTFSVSDDPGQPPLTPGPNYQGKGGDLVPVHLLPGPDRQLWVATVALARLRLTSDALQPDGDPVALGVSTQPLVYEAGYLFNARSRPYTNSVILTRTNRDDLTSDWQAVLGSQPIAFSKAGDNLICVNDAGVVFRIGARQWSGGKFATEGAARLQVHEELATPLRAIPISKDRIAVVCGDPEPRCWIVGATGQIEGSPQLPQSPEADPLMIGDRLVVPLPGQLHSVKLSGQAQIQDLTLPTGEVHPWLDVVATGADRAVAVTRDGLLIQVRLVTAPKEHLAEAGRIELGFPVSVGLGASLQYVAVADGSQRLTLLAAEQFEPVGTRVFEQAISSRPVVVGSHVLVESGLQELHSLEAADGLPTKWTLPLNGSPLVGAAEFSGNLVLAQQNGVVSIVNSEQGEVVSQTNVGSLLAKGPILTPTGVYVATLDNTLIAIPVP